MDNELTSYEKKAMELLVKLDDSFRSILKEQLQNARIHRKVFGTSLVSCFDIENTTQRFRMSYRVPIEIVLDPEFHEEKIIWSHGKPVTLYMSENAIGLQFHFQDGKLMELEIYSVSCKEVQLDAYDNAKAVYLLYDDDFYSQQGNA